MSAFRIVSLAISIGTLIAIGACSRSSNDEQKADEQPAEVEERRSTIWDLFENRRDTGRTYQVNRYIWYASLDVLNFLPLESVDPFTGVIVTGWGRPPGGGKSYRAIVRVVDPALDARSLELKLETRSGNVDPDTLSSVERAILTRARQLRLAEERL